MENLGSSFIFDSGGGFSLDCENLGECSTIRSLPVLFFFLVEIVAHTNSTL